MGEMPLTEPCAIKTSAVAYPMPLFPPVTNATLFSNRIISISYFEIKKPVYAQSFHQLHIQLHLCKKLHLRQGMPPG